MELLSFGSQPHEYERQEIERACEEEKSEISHAIKGAVLGENISDG